MVKILPDLQQRAKGERGARIIDKTNIIHICKRTQFTSSEKKSVLRSAPVYY